MHFPNNNKGGICHSFLFQLLISSCHIICDVFIFMLNKVQSISMSIQFLHMTMETIQMNKTFHMHACDKYKLVSMANMISLPAFSLAASDNTIDGVLSWVYEGNIKKHMYSISQEICTRFLLCCALLWLYIDWLSHIHQANFTGTVAI